MCFGGHGGLTGAPELSAYKKQASIKEEERCTSCQGLGTQRVRHSMTGVDWRTCHACHGSGIEPEWRKTQKQFLKDLSLKK